MRRRSASQKLNRPPDFRLFAPLGNPDSIPTETALNLALPDNDCQSKAIPRQPVPHRHWRSYGNDPLPALAEALANRLPRFRWFLRIICDRCGQQRMFSETHSAQRDMLIRDILYRMRHDGCGGRPGRVELLTGIEGPAAGRCGGSC